MMNPAVKTGVVWANLIGLILLALCGWYYVSEQREAERNDRPYLEYQNLPFPTQQSAVRVGYTVPLTIHRCNIEKEIHVYTFTARLVNEDDATVAPINLGGAASIQLEPGCRIETSNANRVPTSTPPGFYHLEGYAAIPSRLRMYLVPWRSQRFQVVADVKNEPT